MHNLKEEVTCSVCIHLFEEPKQLPCLHIFCLECLNDLARTSGRHRNIKCPLCQVEVAVPESGSMETHGSHSPKTHRMQMRISYAETIGEGKWRTFKTLFLCTNLMHFVEFFFFENLVVYRGTEVFYMNGLSLRAARRLWSRLCLLVDDLFLIIVITVLFKNCVGVLRSRWTLINLGND